MRKPLTPFLFLAFTFFACLPLRGQNGCTDCQIRLPDSLARDTIYLSRAPNGRVGEPYEADISFRLPLTTNPVAAMDSTVTPGLNIQKITINTVSNVPPGLNWKASKQEFNLAEGTDGCVRFCGTPLQPGLYLVDVVVTAQIFVISQTTSFSFPILIEPAQAVTDGFTMINNSGCGEVTVSFTNNVPSNSHPNVSYNWDFGNGKVSTEESPAEVTYSTPGAYPVTYQAIVDTLGPVLTEVIVEEVGCGDFLGRPDLQVKVYNEDNREIYSTMVVPNVNPPLSFILNIPIGEGNYRLRVLDDDNGLSGPDDICGDINFNVLTNGRLQSGDLIATLKISNRIDTIRSVDTVFVFEQPAKPEISGYNGEPLCAGDAIRLFSSYPEDNQWYHDSIPAINGDQVGIQTSTSGQYWVTYVSPNGCQATSEPVTVFFAPLPKSPVFTVDRNLLTVYEANKLPADRSLQWSLNNTPIPGATDTTLCIGQTGSYKLELVDESTGCSNTYSRNVSFDPTYAGCITTSVEERFNELVREVTLFPNPTQGQLRIRFYLENPQEISLRVFNAQGQLILLQSAGRLTGDQILSIDLDNRPEGLYVVELRAEEAWKGFRVMKR